MKEEYEKLYSEFLTKQITTYKEKHALQRQLKRAGMIQRMLSEFVCDSQCMTSWWKDPRTYPRQRQIKIALCTVVFVVFLIIVSNL